MKRAATRSAATRSAAPNRDQPLVLALAILLAACGLATAAQAGVFIGADAEEVDRIVHPRGYVGVGGTIEIGVCLNPDSADSPVVDCRTAPASSL